MVLAILLMLAMAIPSGPWTIPTTQGMTTSRVGIFGCPESMPPPEVNGVHRGDWKIKCDILVIRMDIKLDGNLQIEFGGSLTLRNISSIEQVVSPVGPFELKVKSMATLDIEKSALKVDRMVGENGSAMVFNASSVRSRGGIGSTGGLFTVLDSDIKVYSDFYGGDPRAELNITPEVGSIQRSTLLVQGANGLQGNATALPQNGGEARARFLGPLIRNTTLTVNGGAGGQGWDSSHGNGQHGARGGEAVALVTVDMMDGVAINVNGGFGGQGGSGVGYMSGQNGGSGGGGGVGGDANLSFRSKFGNITSSIFQIRGGPGGAGGDGGSSKGVLAGNGGNGAVGGLASLSVEVPRLLVYDDSVTVEGGSGGRGGSYGKDYSGVYNGLPGSGGMGGAALQDLHAYGDLQVLASQLTTLGGPGAAGGTGWQFGGDGGPGANVTTSLFSGGDLTIGPDVPQDPNPNGAWPRPTRTPKISSMGGDGGDGGAYEFGSPGSEAYMGHAGRSGDGTVAMDSQGIANVHRTALSSAWGRPAAGNRPTTGLRTGLKHLLFDAARYTVEDSTSDTTFEGLTGQGLGILRNTTVTNGPIVLVWQTEPAAMVEVWWYLRVNLTPMFDQQNAEVSFLPDASSSVPNRTCILHGSWDHCNLLLEAEVITGLGLTTINYSVRGMTDDGIASSPVDVILSHNMAITLVPAGDFFAPHVNITTPEDAVSYTVKDMATGKAVFRGMSWEDLRNPSVGIKDVELEFLNWRTGQVDRFDNSSGVTLMNVSQTVFSYTYDLDLRAKDGFSPKWASGPYQVCARSYDGALWSDDKDTRRGGGKVCIYMLIFQEEAKVPVTQIPNTFPARIDAVIPEDGNYIEVAFDTKTIFELGANGKFYSFQWDFDSDGAVDWSYFPTTGTHPPAARFVYTRPGIYMARLTITDINGDTSTIDTQVNIAKEVTEPSAPSTFNVPFFCLPTVLVFIVCILLVYLLTVLNEGFKFSLLTKVMVPLDRRFRKELKNEDSGKRMISDYLRERPGRFFNKVMQDLELGSVTMARELMDLEEEGYAVHKIEGTHVRLISTREKKEVPKKGLRPHQRAILKALIRHPWLTPMELAEDLGRTAAYISHQLYKLEQKGLITMTLDPVEGPLYRVKPTQRRGGPQKDEEATPAPMPEKTPTEERRKCPECGKETRPKWKLCAYCGTPLRKGVVATPEFITPSSTEPTGPNVPTEEKQKCPGCRRDIKPRWKVCAYCGITLRKVTATRTGLSLPTPRETVRPKAQTEGGGPKCPGCGKEIKPRWKSCAYCGTTLRKVTATKMEPPLPSPLEPARPTGLSRPPRPVKPKKVVRERLPPPPIPPGPAKPPKDEQS